MTHPTILASDMEGVLTPEIWIAVAERTGIERLRLTTRDIPDYDELMRGRIAILREHGLRLADIQRVIASIEPLPGAAEFVQQARARAQLIILSDTFYEFAAPLMVKLGQPTLFCHTLETDADGSISGYRLRLPDSKTAAVRALRGLGFRTVAVGDSYNDTGMLAAADQGVLFRPPANVAAEFPQFPVAQSYDELLALI
ncbi:MAG: bifunctional phosphoserine phosphatase/homoserine phosphotransferase ThrH [Chloroflexota bacterium]|nr:MAG: bifunctional phosphoserine phosphatase/homoserine phosphotransferase ThrH [Chloroflexota bacterium]